MDYGTYMCSGMRLNPFCNVVKDASNPSKSCTVDRSAVAVCNLQELQPDTGGFTDEYQVCTFCIDAICETFLGF